YNLFACFSSIKDHISNLLIKLSLDDNIEIPLRRVTSGIFVGNITEDSTLSNGVYVMLRSEVFRSNTKAFIHTPDIKIASSDDINTIIQHALPGVAMELMECAPGGLPERMDTVWLKINVADVLWSKMQRDKNISLYWVAAPEDLYIELIIVPSSPDDYLLDEKL
ncbi:type VI secretion system baseplate subunit TssK, partial [Escherichia coli]